MSQPKPVAKSLRAIAWIIATVLIVAPFVGLLWVPWYAKAAPKVAGFPFFYWYQLAWVPAIAVLSVLAYLLVGRPRGAGGASVAVSGGAGSAGGAGSGSGAGATREGPGGDGYGQPPAGGWYGDAPGDPPAGGTRGGSGTGSGSGTETKS